MENPNWPELNSALSKRKMNMSEDRKYLYFSTADLTLPERKMNMSEDSPWISASSALRSKLRIARRGAMFEIREAMHGFLSETAAENGIPSDFAGGAFEKSVGRYNSVLDFSKPLGLLPGLEKISDEDVALPKYFSEQISSSQKFNVSFCADFSSYAKFYVRFLIFGKEKSRLAEYLDEPSSPYYSVFKLPPEPEKIARFIFALKTKTAPFVDCLFASKIIPWDELREKMQFEYARTMKILKVEAAGIGALLSELLEDFSEKGFVGRGLESFRVRYKIDDEKAAVAFVPRGFCDVAAFASAFRAFVQTGKAELDGIKFGIVPAPGTMLTL